VSDDSRADFEQARASRN